MIHDYRKAVILGLGASGEGAARLLLSEGCGVAVVDAAESPALFERAHELEQDGARVFLGAEEPPDEHFDVCVVSPGVPSSSPLLQALLERGVPVISELELAWTRSRGPVLAVTGSNGKSSVVKWCAEALEAQGRHPVIAGNYGPAFSEAVRIKREADPWVIEVSSFQLEWIEDFRPDVGVFLNLLPNHLDRHGSLREYLHTKARIFENARQADICICHHDWLEQVQAAVGRRGLWWSFDGCPQSDYMFSQGRILHHGGVIAHLEGTYFDNEVLGPAAGAVVAALRPFGVSPEQAVDVLKTFEPLPHRMQKIVEVDDVAYIDDSKATNLAGMMGALRMAGRPVRLIAGGLPKEDDFGSAKEILAQRARSVYLIGTASNSMASAWSGVVPVTACDSLEDAVRRARRDAASGDAVLLSPGCASFDQFRDYAQRGEVFAEIVNRLAEEEVR